MSELKPNAELAYRVLDHIDAHPEQHDQTVWYRQNECGTAGCFAGWVVMLAGHKVEPIPGGRSYAKIDGDPNVSMSDAAEHALGIGGVDVQCHLGCGDCGVMSSAASALFEATNTREDLGRLVAEIFGPRPGGDGMSSLYDCCPAAPTQPHTSDCGLSRSGGDADA